MAIKKENQEEKRTFMKMIIDIVLQEEVSYIFHISFYVEKEKVLNVCKDDTVVVKKSKLPVHHLVVLSIER